MFVTQANKVEVTEMIRNYIISNRGQPTHLSHLILILCATSQLIKIC